MNWKREFVKFFLLFSIPIFVGVSFIFPHAVFAAGPFAPGETLDPGCAPGSANCTILTVNTADYFIGTSTATSTFQGPLQAPSVVTNNIVATGSATIGNLSGLLFGTNGLVSAVSTSSLAINSDNLVQGTVNKFYTDAFARSALSSTVAGISYATSTGIFSLTSGFVIPLTASTTEWSTFYNTPSTRITAGTGLSWSGNTLNASGGGSGNSAFSLGNGYIYNATSSDNVGIGSSTPSSKLTVNGDTYISGNLTATGTATFDSVTTSALNFSASTSISYDSAAGDMILSDDNSGAHTLTQLVNGPAVTACGQTNEIISGGVVTYSGSGFVFDVSPVVYCINGLQYSINTTSQVTLPAADSTRDRIDSIIVNTASAATSLQGTPATNPVEPSADPLTQLALSFIYVKAASTQPGTGGNGPIQETIYQENTEWTGTQVMTTGAVSFSSTVDPQQGSKNIEVTTPIKNNSYFQFSTSSVGWNPTNFQSFSFYVKLKSAFVANNDRFSISFRNTSGALLGTAVTVSNGTYGFDRTNTASYQKISIPLSAFGALGTAIKYVRFTELTAAAANTLNFRIDNIVAQGTSQGTTTSSFSSGTVKTGTTNSLAFYSGTTTVSSADFLIIDATSSRLGIGTSSPTEKLSVSGNALFTGLVKSSSFTATSSVASSFVNASTTNLTASGTTYLGSLSGLLFGTNGLVSAVSTSSLFINTDNLVQGSTNRFSLIASTTEWSSFFTTPSTRITAGTGLSWSGNTLNATGGSGNSAFSLGNGYIYNATSSDNVGIGTSTPAAKLGVSGNVYVAGNITATGTLAVSGVATSSISNVLELGAHAESVWKNAGLSDHFSFVSAQDASLGDSSSNGITAISTGDPAWNSYGYIRSSGTGTGTPQWTTFQEAFDGSINHYTTSQLTTTATDTSFALLVDGSIKTQLSPTIADADNNTAYVFDTIRANASTSLAAFRNNGVNVLSMSATGNVGIGNWAPNAKFSVTGNAVIGGDFVATGSATIGTLNGIVYGTNGFLSTIATSSLFINTDNLVQGSTNRFSLIASTTEWSSFFTTPSTRITAGTGLSWSGNTLNATGGGSGNSAFTIGNGFIFNATTSDAVGIGSSTPYSTLTVQGSSTNPTRNLFALASSTGVQVLTVTANGNVGIGSSSPVSSLVVSSSTSNATFLSYDPGAAVSSDVFQVGSSSGSLYLNVTQAGNVGVGTSSPVSTFAVTGNTTLSGTLTLNSLSSVGTPCLAISTLGVVSTTTCSTSISTFSLGNGFLYNATSSDMVGIGSSTPTATLAIQGSSTNPTRNLLAVASSTGTQFLTVGANGNVGIGSTTPTSLFAVSGNTTLIGNTVNTGTLTIGGNLTTNVTGSTQCLHVNSSGVVSGTGSDCGSGGGGVTTFNVGNGFLYTATSSDMVGIGSSTPWSTLTVQGSSTNPTRNLFAVASSTGIQFFTILANGNVGIGSSSPISSFVVSSSTSNSTYLNYDPGTSASTDLLQVASTSGTTYFNISSAGLVGVGTTSPVSTFAVTGNTTLSGSLTLNSLSSVGSPCLAISSLGLVSTTTCSTGGGVTTFSLGNGFLYNATTSDMVGIGSSSPTATLSIQGSSTNPTRNLLAVASSTGTQLFTVASNGNITTNITGSTQCLHVNSSGVVSGTGSDCGAGGGGVTTFSLGNGFLYTATSSDMVGIGSSTPTATLSVQGSSTNPTRNIFSAASSTGTQFFTVAANGNIGIGTSSPLNLFTVDGGTSLSPITGAFVTGSSSQYLQFNVQNRSASTTASSDYIATANNGNASSYYVDLGINSSLNTDPAYTLFAQNDAYLYSSDNSLNIGTASSSAASALKFFTGGTLLANERMRIDSTGNVGIGTTTPTKALTVYGDILNSSTTATSTFAGGFSVDNGAINHDWSTLTTTIDNLSTGPMSFAADSGIVNWIDMAVTASSSAGTVASYSANLNGNPIFTVYGLSDGAGGVTSPAFGVGSSSPTASFVVQGTSSLPIFVAASSTGVQLLTLRQNGNFGVGSTTAYATMAIQGSSLYPTTDIFAAASSTGTQFLTVKANGNVGIGSTTPTSIFAVSGTSTFIGGVNINGNLTTNVTGSTQCLHVNSSGLVTGSGSDCGAGGGVTTFSLGNGFLYNATTSDMIGIGSSTPWSTLSVQGSTTNPTRNLLAVASSTGTQFFTILAGGNVGIASSSPIAQLSVQGISTAPTRDLFDLASSTGAELFTVTSNGNVGIGSTTPYSMFVVSSSTSNSTYMSFDPTVAASSDIFQVASSTGTLLFNVTGAGKVGIGTTTPVDALHVYITTATAPVRFENSNGYCEINPTTTTWSCTSDQRLKKEITELAASSSLDKLDQIQAVTFRWNSQTDPTLRYGFIAQQVEPIFPEFVTTDPNGYKSVSYGSFTPLIVSAIQELNKRVTTLESLVASSSPMAQVSSGSGFLGSFVNALVGRFNKVQVETGIEMRDQATNEIYCVHISAGQLINVKGECSNTPTSSLNDGKTTTGVTTSTPAVVPSVISTSTSTATTTIPSTITTSTSTASIATSTPPSTATSTATTTIPSVIKTSTSTPPVATTTPVVVTPPPVATSTPVVATSTPVVPPLAPVTVSTSTASSTNP